MKYISTRSKNLKMSFSEALLRGTAADGGLPVFEEFPDNCLNWDEVLDLSYQQLAVKIGLLLTDLSESELKSCVDKAYSTGFESEGCPIAIKSVNEQVHILELFHGPTAAFKDMALQILPQFIDLAVKKEQIDKEVCIVTATSGDTGSAAIYGFSKSANARTITVYPDKGISDVQRAQMENCGFSNSDLIKVDGCFDDAQRAVKSCLADSEFRKKVEDNGSILTVANSMNIGRLIPQVVYYVFSYAELVRSGAVKLGDSCDVAVPSGNFGNILAAWYAKKLGVPFRKFICASNENQVLADFFKTGVYDRRRDFVTTLSPSMDILVSSNLERLLFGLSNDANLVKELQEKLVDDGFFEFDIKDSGFMSGCANDEETVETIGSFYKKTGYVLDPHTAVAIKVVEDLKEDETPVLVASTASPFKFPETVLKALGEEDLSLERLAEVSGMKMPDELARVLAKGFKKAPLVPEAELKNVLKRDVLNEK